MKERNKGKPNLKAINQNDMSNSLIEGKSFSIPNAKKKGTYDDRVPARDTRQSAGNEQNSNVVQNRNKRDLDNNSRILDQQSKELSSAFIGPYPISSSKEEIGLVTTSKENDIFDKKVKQKAYVKELEEQIRLRDQIKKEEEEKIKAKRGNIDNIKEYEFNITPQWSNLQYEKAQK